MDSIAKCYEDRTFAWVQMLKPKLKGFCVKKDKGNDKNALTD